MGTITVTINTEINDLLQKLALESEKTDKELVEELIKKEDEKRHVTVVPFEGEKRFKCTCKKCFETQTRSTEIIEEGN